MESALAQALGDSGHATGTAREMIALRHRACNIPRVQKLIPIFFSATLCLYVIGCAEQEGTEVPEPKQEDDQPSFEPPPEENGGETGN